jgi:predicted phosphodiesterase
MLEDPTRQTHACDGALYGHRHSYQYRWRPELKPAEPGSLTAHLREEQALEDQTFDPDEDYS